MTTAGPLTSEPDLYAEDIKAWIQHTYRWTPAVLVRTFAGVFHNICYNVYANDYNELWAVFSNKEAIDCKWLGSSAELHFEYRRFCEYSGNQQAKHLNQQLDRIVNIGVEYLRNKHKLRVQREEFTSWGMVPYEEYHFNQDYASTKRIALRVFGTNSEWTQKKICAENHKIRNGVKEDRVKHWITSR